MSDEIKINFGCGGNILQGWQNYDRDCDLEKLPLPFPDNHADMVLAEHIFEHFSPPYGLKLLEEFRRILKPGGVLRLLVPVVGLWLDKSHARDLISNHGHLSALNENLVVTMLWCAGFEIEGIRKTGYRDTDGHRNVIGEEKDSVETFRCEALK